MDQGQVHGALYQLVVMLLAERGMRGGRMAVAPARSTDDASLWTQLRGLLNTRGVWPADAAMLDLQDDLLRSLVDGVVHVEGVDGTGVSFPDGPASLASPLDAHGRLLLWRGDITRLAADAVVNAASPQMLGCWAPGHPCVDNDMHTFAGMELRLECAGEMSRRGQTQEGRLPQALDPDTGRPAGDLSRLGYLEPAGGALLTGAYCLSARHVIHTVAPFIASGQDGPDESQRAQLASCYASCLDAAAEACDRSVAFPCLGASTYGYPGDQAAQVAADACLEWLRGRDAMGLPPRETVVLVAYTDTDEQNLRAVLGL